MKNTHYLLLASILLLNACKKDTATFDYSKIKIKQSVTQHNSVYDTIRYTYTGEDVQTVTNYSNDPTFFYTFNYTKNGSKYDYSTFYGTTPTHQGFYNINAQGLFDTSSITNIITTNINNRDRYYYNSDGYNVRAISNYNTYENDVKKYYNSEGDYSYWIYDFSNFITPSNSYRDSVVFEYYTDENHVAFEYALQDRFGKRNKHLVKKRSSYNSVTGTLKSTYEYEYVLDSKGLVKNRIWRIYNQPGNVLTDTRITDYQYYE
ncbi:MAG: hypothetical protein R2739_02975 [Chitinophagales bacterium]|nr:hypothetical protein [Bacteroidota bacterium]